MSAAIKVHPFRLTNGSNNLRAFVDVEIGGVRIYGCRIVQQPGQKAWLSMPQNTWVASDQKRRYSPIVELSDRLKEMVNEAVLAEWERRS